MENLLILVVATVVLGLVLWSLFKQPRPTIWQKPDHIWRWPPQRTFRRLLSYGATSLRRNKKRHVTPRNDWSECGADYGRGLGESDLVELDSSLLQEITEQDTRPMLSRPEFREALELVTPGLFPEDEVIHSTSGISSGSGYSRLDAPSFAAAGKIKHSRHLRMATEVDDQAAEKAIEEHRKYLQSSGRSFQRAKTVTGPQHYPGVLTESIFPRRDTLDE